MLKGFQTEVLLYLKAAVTPTYIGCYDNSPNTGRTFTYPGYFIPNTGFQVSSRELKS